MSNVGWSREGFLNFVGLDPRTEASDKAGPVQLAEAAIDPRTGGAVAVTTDATLDGDDGVTHIKTNYWRMLPSGEHVSQQLFDIELKQGKGDVLTADGQTQPMPTMVPRAVYVLGRKVYDEGNGHAPTEAQMHNLTRVMGAVGKINHALREGQMPEVAKILEESAVQSATGENLPIVGQSPEGGFSFHPADASGTRVNGAITVPTIVARALMGFGVNTLDEHQRLRPKILVQTDDSRTGTVFNMSGQIEDGGNIQASTSIAPAPSKENRATQAIPCLTNAAWKSNADGTVTLQDLNVLGQNLTLESQLRRMRALGATNRIIHDLRKRKYAPTMDYLFDYDLNDLVYHLEPPPLLSDGGRLTMISLGGNNLKEVAGGFGDTIGGNSKVVYHEGVDKDGKTDRVGVIIDLGLYLSPKDEVNVSAAPDVVEPLKYCNDILITHRHLDHTDGLFAYMQHGFLRGKTVHATPEVIRALRDKLRTYNIHQDDLPRFAELKGEGWLHIKDSEGKTRLSVNFSRNAVPHSARTTPFFVHGHYDGKWIGSYLDLGDARFGQHNSDDYDGPPVASGRINKAFFSESNKRFLEEMERVEPNNAQLFDKKIADRGPTYFDMDVTSIEKDGWGTTEYEDEENLSEISRWFKDKGMIMSMISTNDNRFETALRMAARTDRDIVAFGSNLEKTATTMNILGVNDELQEPENRGNIQRYLDMCFEERIRDTIKALEDKVTSGDESEKTKKKLVFQENRLALFQKLSAIDSAFARYNTRHAWEESLKKSVDNDTIFDEDTTLGPLYVGRTSKTSKAIMGMDGDSEFTPGPDGRRLVLLTGTQGTNVEMDAALTKLSESRSLLDANPDITHTARPIIPENNVVVISQTAIPGNKEKQDWLVSKSVARNFAGVVQALHDGFQMHDIDSEKSYDIERRLKELGKRCEKQGEGLHVYGMPIHAGGHGQAEDCRAWLKLIGADVTAAQHTSSERAGQCLAELCKAEGRRYMGRIVPNYEGLSIRAGDSPESTEITSLGLIPESIIRIVNNRKVGDYHGGHLDIEWLINQGVGGLRSDGLLATVARGWYQKYFATVDAEEAARIEEANHPGRPEPDLKNTSVVSDATVFGGPPRPGAAKRHRALHGEEPYSAEFGGGRR